MPSSVIRRFAYDEECSRLDIVFTSGRRYSYHGVAAGIAAGMRAAPSKGEYFNAAIKDRYAFTRQD